MDKSNLKFAFVMGLLVTSYVTFTLVAVNVGFVPNFLFLWFRSWLIAFLLVTFSLLYVAPVVRKKIK